MATQTAMFGAGCFWGVEEFFRLVPGVTRTLVGYSGGKTENPTYKEVCSDTTGHAEVIWLEFDPSQVSYEQLVSLFFEMHDPTTLNRQGPDYGSQYRSAIFTYSDEQSEIAKAAIHRLAGKFAPRKIVTQVEPAGAFTPAEDYHQRYLEKRGLPSCHI